MKSFSILFSFLFVSFCTYCQVSVNVYWTEQTEMNPSNTIYYSTSKQLSWPDFKGSPGPSSPVAAITASGFGYKANMSSSNGKGEINVAVYCYFNKNKSWVRPGKTTPYILNHEQHHFDVSFLAAVNFISKIKNAGLTVTNCNTLLQKIYKDSCDFMGKMQDDYDGQTMNGQLADKQQQWNNFFIEKLSLATK